MPLMLAGKQPSDKEHLAGLISSPAGQLLDNGLNETDIDRSAVNVTNAVKHFKFLRPGTIQVGRKPAAGRDPGLSPLVGPGARFDAAACDGGAGRGVDALEVRESDVIGKNRGQAMTIVRRLRAPIAVHPFHLRFPTEAGRQ